MMMLGNPDKRIYLAIVGIHYLLPGHTYQAPPSCGLWAAQHGVSRGSSDSVPVPTLKSIASDMVERARLDSSVPALGPWQGLAQTRCPNM